jgi:uncharacterized membrane protein
MSEMTGGAITPNQYRTGDMDRPFGFTVYGLYLASFAVPLAPAIVGVAIAYARRAEADPVSRSHFTFQIRTFWIVFWLSTLALALMLAGFGTAVADGIDAVARSDAWDWAAFDGEEMRATPMTIALFICAAVVGTAAVIWFLVASVFGIARLASSSPMGDSRGR